MWLSSPMVCEQCLVQVTRYVNSKEKISSGLWAISLSLFFSSLHPKRQFNELFNLNIWGKARNNCHWRLFYGLSARWKMTARYIIMDGSQVTHIQKRLAHKAKKGIKRPSQFKMKLWRPSTTITRHYFWTLFLLRQCACHEIFYDIQKFRQDLISK